MFWLSAPVHFDVDEAESVGRAGEARGFHLGLQKVVGSLEAGLAVSQPPRPPDRAMQEMDEKSRENRANTGHEEGGRGQVGEGVKKHVEGQKKVWPPRWKGEEDRSKKER